MKFSSASNKVHELEPKTMGILLQRVNNIWYRFLVTSGCQLSGKVWWAVQISRLWQKIEVFYRPEWTKVINLKMNCKCFQIQKWMSQAGRGEKNLRWKNGAICVVFMFPSWIMILKLSKKVHFFNFVLTSAKKSKYVKAIYI